MSLKARHELLHSVAPRYRDASKPEKQRILSEFTASTGYHRKYAITLLNQVPAPDAVSIRLPARRTRRARYDTEVQAALVTTWEAAGRICSKRLVPFLPQLVGVLERRGYLTLTDRTRERLLAVSAATADRLLARTRQADKPRGRTTTLPGSLLKHHVPIRTFSDWDELRVGFVEADLVAHCGTSTAGSYLHTLTLTDVATGWTECLALPYRDQETVLRALKVGRERLPFRLLGLDTDNGSEFLNYGLLDYCAREQVTFTRSRAYKKNDQCHVEEKNGSVVRRFVGYDRFEGLAPCRALAELYRTLRLYVNFFQPSMKLLSKERQGSKVVKKYDEAKTPCQRVLASSDVPEVAKQALREQFNGLDPVALLAEVERLQDRLWQHAYEPGRTPVGDAWTSGREARRPALAPGAVVRETSAAGGDGACAPVVLARDGAGALASAAPPAPPRTPRSERRYRKTKRQGRYHLVKHTWRTRPDPFAGVWEEVEAELRRQPHREAKGLFLELQRRHPGRFADGQLRTMQRRVKAWRLEQARLVAEEIGQVLSGEGGAVSGSDDRSPVARQRGGELSWRPLPDHVTTTGVPRWSG